MEGKLWDAIESGRASLSTLKNTKTSSVIFSIYALTSIRLLSPPLSSFFLHFISLQFKGVGEWRIPLRRVVAETFSSVQPLWQNSDLRFTSRAGTQRRLWMHDLQKPLLTSHSLTRAVMLFGSTQRAGEERQFSFPVTQIHTQLEYKTFWISWCCF